MSIAAMSPSLRQPTPFYRGNQLLWGALSEISRDPITLFNRLLPLYPDVVRTRIGPLTVYIVFNADYAKYVLQTNHQNYVRPTNFSRMLIEVGGVNLFSSEGAYWQRQRKVLAPAFHRKRILNFGRIMTEEAEKMLARWEKAAFPIDIQSEMTGLTLNIVGRALFGVDMLADGWGQQLSQGFAGTTGWLNYRFGHPFSPPTYVPTRINRRFKQARATVQRVIREIIAERRQKGGEHHDFLQMLLELRYEDSGDCLTDEQIMNEAATFFFAGHETTANTLTWTFYLLAQHPEAEAKLHAELGNVLSGRSATIGDVPDLTYTRMIIQEAMRLYPAAWITTRQPIANDQLGPYPIKAGSTVMLGFYGIHRNPTYWQNPDIFDPERFTPERSANRPSHAYMPFGNGPRFCIGSQFAMNEAQIILATIAQRYSLRTPPGYQVRPDTVFTLRVRDTLPMVPA